MTEAEIDLMKKQIEVQLEEYAESLNAYEAWMADWRARHGLPPAAPDEATA